MISAAKDSTRDHQLTQLDGPAAYSLGNHFKQQSHSPILRRRLIQPNGAVRQLLEGSICYRLRRLIQSTRSADSFSLLSPQTQLTEEAIIQLTKEADSFSEIKWQTHSPMKAADSFTYLAKSNSRLIQPTLTADSVVTGQAS